MGIHQDDSRICITIAARAMLRKAVLILSRAAEAEHAMVKGVHEVVRRMVSARSNS